MSKQKILFIINPNSGRKSKNKNIERKIRKSAGEAHVSLHFEYTSYPGHAAQLCSGYLGKGFRHFVAVGGDGTVNEIASKLMHHTEAVLSIIPLGSGNGLARHLGIPFDLEHNLATIFSGKSRLIDAGTINDIPFFCTAGIGFDAHCAGLFNKGRHSRGFLNYIRIILGSYMSFRAGSCMFEDNPVSYFSLTFGNTSQFGNDAYITPDAIADDGFIDCTLIKDHPKYHGAELAIRLMNKTITRSKYTEYYRSKMFRVEAVENLLIHFDGESKQLNDRRLQVKVIEKAVRVTVTH